MSPIAPSCSRFMASRYAAWCRRCVPAAIAQTLLPGHVRGRDDRLVAGRIHGHRLFGEHVLAGGNRGLQVGRPESGRRREDHVVDVAGDHLLVRVPPGELLFLGHCDLVPELRQVLEALGETVREQVADGHEPDARSGGEHVVDGARAAPAASDHADADLVASSGEGSGDVDGRGERAANDGRRGGAQEIAPGGCAEGVVVAAHTGCSIRTESRASGFGVSLGFADHAEAHKRRVGVPPLALRVLRITAAPLFFR